MSGVGKISVFCDLGGPSSERRDFMFLLVERHFVLLNTCFCSERTLEPQVSWEFFSHASVITGNCHFPLKLTPMPHFPQKPWMHIQVLPDHHNSNMTKSSSSTTTTNSAVCVGAPLSSPMLNQNGLNQHTTCKFTFDNGCNYETKSQLPLWRLDFPDSLTSGTSQPVHQMAASHVGPDWVSRRHV